MLNYPSWSAITARVGKHVLATLEYSRSSFEASTKDQLAIDSKGAGAR